MKDKEKKGEAGLRVFSAFRGNLMLTLACAEKERVRRGSDSLPENTS